MGKFDGILFCTDLDGTLLRNDKTVSKENLAAIEYFKSEGGFFTFITGRMPYYSQSVYDIVRPNTAIGCYSGGGLYDFGKEAYVWTNLLPTNVLLLVQFIEEHVPGVGIQLNTLENAYFSRTNEATEKYANAIKYHHPLCRPEEISSPFAKIVFADTNKQNIAHVEHYLSSHPLARDFTFLGTEAILYEILPKGTHKGKALQKLSEYLSIPIEKTIAIGDYDNDIGMLQQAGLGIAVANATESAKAAADHTTVSNEEHAVARVINGLNSGEITLP